jgi:hypothetical protein
MQNDMQQYDYHFEQQESGLEWYKCLDRVYDDYLQPNLADENTTPSTCLYVSCD